MTAAGTPLIERLPATLAAALAPLSRDPRLTLAEGRDEIEIWVSMPGGKRLKVGGQPTGADGADGTRPLTGYLSHVFLLVQGRLDAAAGLGFTPEIGAGGQRQWVLPEEAEAGAFAAGILALLGPAPEAAAPEAPEPAAVVRAFLRPERIAILHAGGTAGHAGRLAAALEAAGFGGEVVGPAPLAAPPRQHVDLAVLTGSGGDHAARDVAIVLSRTTALLVLEASGSAGFGGLIAPESAGFPARTIGPAGGVFHAAHGLALGALPGLSAPASADGPIALVAQSSGLAAHIVAAARSAGVALGIVAAVGTPADGGMALETMIAAMAADDGPRAILAAIEAVADAAALEGAVQAARKSGTPVIALDLRPASSADDQGALGALLARAGAWLATDLDEALALARHTADGRLLGGRRLGLIGRASDGALADHLERLAAEHGLRVERLSATAGASVDAILGASPIAEGAMPGFTLDLAPGSGARRQSRPPGEPGADPVSGIDPIGPDPLPGIRQVAALAWLGAATTVAPAAVPAPLDCADALGPAPDGALDPEVSAALLRLAGLATVAPGRAPAGTITAAIELGTVPGFGAAVTAVATRSATALLPLSQVDADRVATDALAKPGGANTDAVAPLATAVLALARLAAGSGGRLSAARLSPVFLTDDAALIGGAAFTVGPADAASRTPPSHPSTEPS